jgi:nucleotide-binding universal stress UspA family protein
MQDVGMNRWTHPEVILLATDLSDLDRLMPFGMQQALQTGAGLILLHVIAPTEALSADLAGMPYYDSAGVLESAGKILEFCCESARKHGVSCSGLVREGVAAKQVLDAAQQFHADRIILGTRSRSKLSKLLIGSVAEQVLRSVTLPVITVGPEARLPVGSNIDKAVVLHATTLREASRSSAALACRIASNYDAKLILLHVLPHADEIDRKALATELDAAAILELRALADATADGCSVCVEPKVVHGNAAIEILAEADHHRACMIVMGSTERSGLQNLTRDRTVYKVLAHAHCPVMSLREAQVKSHESLIARMAIHT